MCDYPLGLFDCSLFFMFNNVGRDDFSNIELFGRYKLQGNFCNLYILNWFKCNF